MKIIKFNKKSIFIYIISLFFTILLTCILYNEKVKYPFSYILIILGISLASHYSDIVLDRFTLKLSLGVTRRRLVKTYFINLLIIYVLSLTYIVVSVGTICAIDNYVSKDNVLLVLLFTALFMVSSSITLVSRIYTDNKKVRIVLFIMLCTVYILTEFIKHIIIFDIVLILISICLFTFSIFYILKRYKAY